MEPDILVKRPDFNRHSTGRALPRWMWELLDLVDGERSIHALAIASGHDVAIIIAFADEMIASEMLVPLTLSYGDFLKYQHVAAPTPRLSVAMPGPAAEAAASKPAEQPVAKKTSLSERVAALKERAIGVRPAVSAPAPAPAPTLPIAPPIPGPQTVPPPQPTPAAAITPSAAPATTPSPYAELEPAAHPAGDVLEFLLAPKPSPSAPPSETIEFTL